MTPVSIFPFCKVLQGLVNSHLLFTLPSSVRPALLICCTLSPPLLFLSAPLTLNKRYVHAVVKSS